MLKFVILKISRSGNTEPAMIKGQPLELTEEDFLSFILRDIKRQLPIDGQRFKRKIKRKEWTMDEIEKALSKSMKKILTRFKRKTIKVK